MGAFPVNALLTTSQFRIGITAALLTAPAYALSTENLSCEMPGVGQAAFITSFEGRYAMFDWWDQAGDALGDQAVVYADCTDGQMLRATTAESSEKFDEATEVLWTAGKAGQGGDLSALAKALTGAGFTVETMPLTKGHCACTDEMMRLSGQ